MNSYSFEVSYSIGLSKVTHTKTGFVAAETFEDAYLALKQHLGDSNFVRIKLEEHKLGEVVVVRHSCT